MTRRPAGTAAAAAAALGLAAGFWWQGERFIAANGPTFDEAVHLAAGYAIWANGDFTLNREDPPLLKVLWAAPLALGDRPPFPHPVAEATNNDHWHVGAALLYDSGVPPARLLTPARRTNLAVGCGVVLLAGWWAFRIWASRLGGLAACAFAAADPNLLALSCVLSTDAGLAFFSLLSAYLLWEYSGAPSRRLLVAAGAALGLLLGSKLSALGMAGAFGVAGLVYVLRGGVLALPGAPEPAGGWTAGNRLRAAVELAFRLGLIGLVVLAATYLFVHFDQWGRGLKFQFTRHQFGDGNVYLLGELSPRGWYHYFLVCLPLKLPLGLLAGAFGAVVLLCMGVGRRPPHPIPLPHTVGERGRGAEPPAHQVASRSGSVNTSPRPCGGEVGPERSDGPGEGVFSPSSRLVWLLVPPLVFLAAVSLSRVNLGVRVALPVLPFLCVVAARLAAPGCCRLVRLALVGGCVAWAFVSSWAAGPHQLTYFNELVGGPENGLRYVADSNIDWGQGLPELKAYLDREGIGVVYLSYFGTDRPEAHGIRYQPLPGYGRVGPPGGEAIPGDAPRHVVAVSANHLAGLYLNDPETFAFLRGRKPAAVPGGCIHVFDLTGDADAIRRVRAIP